MVVLIGVYKMLNIHKKCLYSNISCSTTAAKVSQPLKIEKTRCHLARINLFYQRIKMSSKTTLAKQNCSGYPLTLDVTRKKRLHQTKQKNRQNMQVVR